MHKPVIDAKQALDDIRSGLDDYALMDKYNLSAKGLQSLFNKLLAARAITQVELDRRGPDVYGSFFLLKEEAGEQRPPAAQKPRQPVTIKAKEAVRDIRAGMNDEELMEKYRLTAIGLRNLFDQLVRTGVMTRYEIDSRTSSADETVEVL